MNKEDKVKRILTTTGYMPQVEKTIVYLYIEELVNKVNQLETNIEEAIEYIKRHDQHNGDNYFNLDKYMWDREIDILEILERGKE